MKQIKMLCAVTVSLCGLVSTSQANLVLDGSFELTGNEPFETVTTPLGAWIVTAGSVDLIGTYWGAAEGAKSIDLSGNAPGTISQSITTGPGLYLLTFALWGNDDGQPTTKTVQVTFGSSTQNFTITPTGTKLNPNWVNQTWYVTPGAGSSLLEFKDLSGHPGYYGAALDAISLTAVPEPATMIAGALLLLPFGVSTLRILRKNRAA